MKLEEVLPAFSAGKKIRRKKWIDFIFMSKYENDMTFNLYPSALLANDWEILEECELCQGVKRLSAVPDAAFIYNHLKPKVIDCPECK